MLNTTTLELRFHHGFRFGVDCGFCFYSLIFLKKKTFQSHLIWNYVVHAKGMDTFISHLT